MDLDPRQVLAGRKQRRRSSRVPQLQGNVRFDDQTGIVKVGQGIAEQPTESGLRTAGGPTYARGEPPSVGEGRDRGRASGYVRRFTARPAHPSPANSGGTGGRFGGTPPHAQ